jgi:lysophospholipase L1-like esterase
MKTLAAILYADVAVSLILAAAVLVRSLVILGKPLGAVTIPIVVILVLNAVLGAVTLLALKKDRGRMAARLWLFCFILVVMYLVLDLAGGYFLIAKNEVHTQKLPDDYVHHKYAPNVTQRGYHPVDFDVGIRINNIGFRGEDVNLEKEPGVSRIVMLGDSFTFGAGVRDDETFSAVLEEILNASGTGKFEVLNLGVESYSPVLEYILLKRNIDRLDPGIVIMNLDMSDIMNEFVYRKQASIGTGGEPEAVDGREDYARSREGTGAKIEKWIYSHMFITTALLEMLRAKTNRSATVEDVNVQTGIERKWELILEHTLDGREPENLREMYGMVEDSILRTKQLCDSHGCEFILAIYPWGYQVSDSEWVSGREGWLPEGTMVADTSDRTVEELESFARKNGISFINAFPDFRSYSGDGPLYFQYDIHWTPEGHKVMAETIAEHLLDDKSPPDEE